MRPIDHETLLQRCRNNPSLVEKLLGLFERQVNAQLTSLRQQLQQRNVHALTRITHTIKGTAANLSAEPIRAATAELEAQILANDFESAAVELRTLETHVRECVGYLPIAIAGARRSGKAGTDM
jgi:HPt (histidine-containing phosphotransfer) domain-containing protein